MANTEGLQIYRQLFWKTLPYWNFADPLIYNDESATDLTYADREQ